MDSQYKFCPKCGIRNFLEDKICGVCKTKLPFIVGDTSKSIIQGTKPKTNYWLVALLFGGIVFLYYNVFHKSNSNNETTKTSKTNLDQQQTNLNRVKLYLFSSAHEFKTNFNAYCTDNGITLNIQKMNIQAGEINNSAQFSMLNKQIGFVGSINKNDNSLKSVTMIAQGNRDIDSGADLFLTMLCLIATVDPTLSADERGAILKSLGLLNKDTDILNLSGNITINGIKYFIDSSHQLGVLFGAEIP